MTLLRVDPQTIDGDPVIEFDDLVEGRGVAALVAGHAVAVFLVRDRLYAIDNVDPISGRSVLSRGIVGDADGVVTVASPLYKQRYDLETGACLDAEAAVAVHEVACTDGVVHVRLGPRP